MATTLDGTLLNSGYLDTPVRSEVEVADQRRRKAQDRIFADMRRADLASERQYQCALADAGARAPRNPLHYRYVDEPGLLARIEAGPGDPSLCWPIIRNLCRLRRNDRRSGLRAFGNAIRRVTLSVLIRVEIRRLVAAKRGGV